MDTAIEALGADVTFQAAGKATKPGGTVSNTGYFGEGEFGHIPRVECGVGMARQDDRDRAVSRGQAADAATAARAGKAVASIRR